MTERGLSPNRFLHMARTALDPVLWECGEGVRQIADYDIPKDRWGPFTRFHSFITDPQPVYITRWRSDPVTEARWYHRHVNGVIGDLRGALAAAHYHAERLGDLESAVMAFLASKRFGDRLDPHSTMGLGGTRKLDFEYQAFVLACRRALDYLAGALAAYFGTESNSFRSLPRALKSSTPRAVAEAISQAQARHADDLDFILAAGRRSVRNRIAHYEFVQAGCVNLRADGFFLAGGGEELGRRGYQGTVTLQDAIEARLEALHACVQDIVDSFIDAARAQESNAL